jgi:RNA recognition motif-containing protein
MVKREEGLKAIQELDSKDLLGRSLKVSEARPKFNARRCGRSGGKSSW